MLDDAATITRLLFAAEAQAILGHVAKSIVAIRKQPTARRIQIFSGHDTTVAPLLKSLGIQAIDPPHYAARLVFEVDFVLMHLSDLFEESVDDGKRLAICAGAVRRRRQDSRNAFLPAGGSRARTLPRHALRRICDTRRFQLGRA